MSPLSIQRLNYQLYTSYQLCISYVVLHLMQKNNNFITFVIYLVTREKPNKFSFQ